MKKAGQICEQLCMLFNNIDVLMFCTKTNNPVNMFYAFSSFVNTSSQKQSGGYKTPPQPIIVFLKSAFE